MFIVENLMKSVKDEDIERNYFYRLMKSNMIFWHESKPIKIKAYGIEIERQDTLNGKIVNIERDCIKNISPQIHRVTGLLNTLYRYCVSPFHLTDIIGDYEDECLLDFDNEIKEVASFMRGK